MDHGAWSFPPFCLQPRVGESFCFSTVFCGWHFPVWGHLSGCGFQGCRLCFGVVVLAPKSLFTFIFSLACWFARHFSLGFWLFYGARKLSRRRFCPSLVGFWPLKFQVGWLFCPHSGLTPGGFPSGSVALDGSCPFPSSRVWLAVPC